MCHAAKAIVLSFAAQWISVSGMCWAATALERNWSLWKEEFAVKSLQNRYRADMKVEFAVQIAAKPIQEKLVGEGSALQQYPRLTESVPNKLASSYVLSIGLGFWISEIACTNFR